MRNAQAAGDARHARTGKDGAFFDNDGKLLATVEQFTSNVTWNNSKYSVLGDAQEHETANTFAVSLTMSQVVVESDQFFQDLMDAMKKQTMPSWTFQGSLLGIGGQESEGGDSGHEERVIYRGCVPSGQVDIQNVAVGDVIKRNWNFFVNKPPELQSLLSIDRSGEA